MTNSTISNRYKDDIFQIGDGTKEELISFIHELNKKHQTIKFDYKISTKQIEILDIMVYKDQQHKTHTTIFCKSTDQPYMHNRIIPNPLKTTSELKKNL